MLPDMDNSRTGEAWASSFIERNEFDLESMIPLSTMSGVSGVGDGVAGVDADGEFVFASDLKENFGICDNFFCSAATDCCNCFSCCC
jgi:hypothetical protein